MRTLSDRFLFLFIILSVLGTIKIYIGGNLNWAIALAVLGLSLFFSQSAFAYKQRLAAVATELRQHIPLLAGWALFIGGIALAAAMNGGTGFYTLAKYFALLAVFLVLLLIRVSPGNLEYAVKLALVVAMSSFLLFAVFRVNDALVILGDGRMGWLAVWPGVLWKAGAYAWPIVLWRCLKSPDWKAIVIASLALAAMAVDGSRTSLIWLSLTWVLVLGCGIRFKLPARSFRTHAALLVIAAFTFTMVQPVLLGWAQGHYDALITQKIEQVRAFSFSADTAPTTNPGTGNLDTPTELPQLGTNVSSERLVHGNTTTRKAMLQEGWKQAVDKFPWGGGFGTTMVDDNGSRTVIHMTYLQILGDEGILALAGYLLIVLYPLYRALRYMNERRDLQIARFELMLPSVSILALYMLTGLLHPLSNELTEWALILAATATIIIYGKSDHVARRH